MRLRIRVASSMVMGRGIIYQTGLRYVSEGSRLRKSPHLPLTMSRFVIVKVIGVAIAMGKHAITHKTKILG